MRRPKTLKAAKRRARDAISQYIRQKHAVGGMVKCVTCETRLHWKQMHCGHYQHGLTEGKDRDGKPFVWEENLWPQCSGCNTFNGGRLDLYTLHMIDTYGRDFVERLQGERYKPVKMSIDDWHELEIEYTDKLGDLDEFQRAAG